MGYMVMGSDIWDMDRYPYHISREVLREDCPLHIQEYQEVFMILGGKGTHVLLNSAEPLRRGDAFVWKNNAAHGFLDVENLEYLKLSYLPSRLLQEPAILAMPGLQEFLMDDDQASFLENEPYKLQLGEEDLQYLCAMEQMLDLEQTQHDPTSDAMMKQNILAFLSFLGCRYAKSRELTRRTQVFADARAYILDHLSEKIAVTAVARAVGLSRRQLDRIFQDCCQTGPLAYITQLRMEAATDLLMNTDLELAEIARRMGFEQTRYFSQQYKNFYGISPRKVKRREL